LPIGDLPEDLELFCRRVLDARIFKGILRKIYDAGWDGFWTENSVNFCGLRHSKFFLAMRDRLRDSMAGFGIARVIMLFGER
jgi:hypothetical protein